MRSLVELFRWKSVNNTWCDFDVFCLVASWLRIKQLFINSVNFIVAMILSQVESSLAKSLIDAFSVSLNLFFGFQLNIIIQVRSYLINNWIFFCLNFYLSSITLLTQSLIIRCWLILISKSRILINIKFCLTSLVLFVVIFMCWRTIQMLLLMLPKFLTAFFN